MSDRPILFSGPMVRALLDGRKTQTRRLLPLRHVLPGCEVTSELVNYYGDHRLGAVLTRNGERTTSVQPISFVPGDRLYVRETFFDGSRFADHGPRYYRADGVTLEPYFKWVPSIHMPRWASRITLRVDDVRVQRVQDISEEDAIAEGVSLAPNRRPNYRVELAHPNDLGADAVDADKARSCFMRLWDSLNAKRGLGWDANPWVAALTFRVVKENIDSVLEATS